MKLKFGIFRKLNILWHLNLRLRKQLQIWGGILYSPQRENICLILYREKFHGQEHVKDKNGNYLAAPENLTYIKRKLEP